MDGEKKVKVSGKKEGKGRRVKKRKDGKKEVWNEKRKEGVDGIEDG